jgi:hypothetical protein
MLAVTIERRRLDLDAEATAAGHCEQEPISKG